MKYKNHVREARLFAFCLLSWCLFSGTLSAQCNVYFSYCPGDITITDCDNSGFETINWPTPIAATTGGCINFNIQQTSGPAPGSVVASPGTYTVTYAASAVDMATGKKAKAGCTITIHLMSDNTPPVFTFCPPDITLYTGNDPTAPGIWSTPIVEDNCGENVTVKTKTPCNTDFGPGVHVVTYKAVDASGNAVYCTFTVTVIQGFQKAPEAQHPLAGHITAPGTGPYPIDITLSPNPFRGQFSLYAQRDPETDLEVSILDVQGRQVRLQTWQAGTNSLYLNTEDLNPGVFYIKITTSEGVFVNALRGVKM
ncbi:MAG: HYR domain-containing protein [Lewinellaceae bacterium]|nr:HYR domain-containing protein [Lewinellaceae bacterium]